MSGSIRLLALVCLFGLASIRADVVINEFMASNGITATDEDGSEEDWIELYNRGTEAVNLEGWGLSDNPSNPFKWTFPAVIVEPGEFLLVWASGKDRRPSSLASGDLPPDVEPAIWLRADEVETREMAGNTFVTRWTDLSGNERHAAQADESRQPGLRAYGSYGTPVLVFDGERQLLDFEEEALAVFQNKGVGALFLVAKSGFSSPEATVIQFSQGNSSARVRIGVSENTVAGAFRAEGSRVDGHGTVGIDVDTSHGGSYRRLSVFPRWESAHLVLRQDAGEDVIRVPWHTKGLTSDTPSLAGVIGGRADRSRFFRGEIAEILVFNSELDGNQVQKVEKYLSRRYLTLHTNFSISASGETLQLTRPDASVADMVSAAPLPTDVSYGRFPDGAGTWVYFSESSPGSAATNEGYGEIMPEPAFSHEAGFYTEEFLLELTASDHDALILYTLDGSEPKEENIGGVTYTYKNSFPQNPGQPFGELFEESYWTHVYNDLVSIEDRSGHSDKLTQKASSLHFDPSIYMPVNPVFKGTVVRARLVKSGAMPGKVVTRSYFVTPEGDARYELPVISLATDEGHLFDHEKGNYTAGVDFDD